MKTNCALWLVDVQEALFSRCDRFEEVLEKQILAIKGAKLLDVPLFVTEQMPDKLGATIAPLRSLFPKEQTIYQKSTFSGCKTASIKETLEAMPIETWVLIGIEAHICVLQTAKDLQRAGKKVVVLNDAITSRSLYDFGTAVGEMRDSNIQVTSTESWLYAILEDAKHPKFSPFLELIKQHGH